MQKKFSSKMLLRLIVRILIVAISCGTQSNTKAMANEVPTAVQLGGAIVAAVEADVEQQDRERAKLLTEQRNVAELAQEMLTALASAGGSEFEDIERLLNDVAAGRGTFHKRRKILKYLYPLLVGVLIAKSVILPLILKILTALSSTSFVMSKIALVVTGFLALKWILSGSSSGYYEMSHGAQQRTTKLEIVHLPPAGGGKNYFGGGAGTGNLLDDMNWSDSNLNGALEILPKYHRHKYIPLGGGGAGSIIAFGDGTEAFRYPHRNYEGVYDGKPFL